MLSVIGFLFLLNTNKALCALPPAMQVPFFKSTQSLFPSGYSSIEKLERQQIQKTMLSENVYRWNGQNFKKDELKPVLPVHLSQVVIDISTQQRWKVLNVGVHQLKVQNPITKNIIYFATNEVISDSYDLGYALTLKDTPLKISSDSNSKILTMLSQGVLLKPIDFKNGYVKVINKNLIGYVNLSDTLTKFDLSTMVFSDKRWSFVKRRESDYIVTSENKKVPLRQIKKLVTPDTRGIIASSTQKIPKWSQIEVMKSNRPDWIQSELKGHGAIWWKMPTEDDLGPEVGKTVLIDQLIRQPISSVSFHPKNPLKGILSSNGVYITKDGLHWKNLTQFEKFNGPVLYFNDLLIFVGNFRSVNGGKTFENYIQIDKLAQAIEDQYGFLPKRLQVKKIETKAPFQLKIEIETGYRKIKMESPLFTQEWKAIKF